MSALIYDFLLTTLSLVAWLFLLTAIFVPLELLFSVRRQSVLRPNMLPDVGYFFLGGLIKAFFVAVVIGIVASTARQFIPRSYFDLVGNLPILVQILLAFFAGEIGFYWGHRAVHAYPALWQFHAVHHEPRRMDWLINTRMHPIDLVVTRMFGLMLVAILGLGAPGDNTSPLVPQIVLVFGTVWAFFIHANIRWPMGWLEHIFSTPRFHHWHHSRDDHPDHNFASLLPLFDRIFGTLYMPRGEWPPSYGIAGESAPDDQQAKKPDLSRVENVELMGDRSFDQHVI